MKKTHLLLALLICVLGVYLYQNKDSLLQLTTGSDANVAANTTTTNPNNPSNKSTPKPTIKGLDKDDIRVIERITADVELKPEENNLKQAMHLDSKVGRPLFLKKKYRDTYAVYKKVLKISYNMGSLRGMQIALGILANVQKNLGQEDEGLDTLLLAYKIALAENARYEYGVHELTIADAVQKSDRGMSLMWRLKAKESLEGTPHIQDYVRLLGKLADDLYFFARTEKAMETYEQAYQLSEKIGKGRKKQWFIKQAQYDYARKLTWRDECDKAMPVFDKHFQRFSTDSDKEDWWYTSMSYLRGVCQIKLNDSTAAFDTFMQGYLTYEFRRSIANTDEARAKLDRNNYELVNNIINNHIAAGELDKALLMLESNKAKTLTDIRNDPAQKQIYKEWQDLKLQYLQQMQDIFKDDDDLLKRKSTEEKFLAFFELERQYKEDELKLKLEQESKQQVVSQNMTPEGLNNIQTKLPANTALISVYVNHDSIGLFILTNKEIQYYPSEYTPEQLKLRVKEIKYMISNPHVDYYKLPSGEIYDAIFAEALGSLGNQYKQLVISLDGYFQNMPPGILYDGNKHLTERFILHQYPSLRYYNPELLAKTQPPKNGITCVDPAIENRRLPFQQETSNMITALYNNNVVELSANSCTKTNLETQLASIVSDGFLHIGAYGTFLNYKPMSSGILLDSNNRDEGYYFWNAVEMGATNMQNIKLITLSSCDTGKIDEERPRDVFGILRGLFVAGVDDVIAPLWPTQDRATSVLMQNFYKHYLSHGNAAKALNEAQHALINNKKYQHPYYWAAFISMGGAA